MGESNIRSREAGNEELRLKLEGFRTQLQEMSINLATIFAVENVSIGDIENPLIKKILENLFDSDKAMGELTNADEVDDLISSEE